jgi:hypothetical protein
MSKKIGMVGTDEDGAIVFASCGGVELHADSPSTISPSEARALAGFLVDAAREAEIMLGHAHAPTEERRLRLEQLVERLVRRVVALERAQGRIG